MIKCTFTGKRIQSYGRCTLCTLAGRVLLKARLTPRVYQWLDDNQSILSWDTDCIGDNHYLLFKLSATAVQSTEDSYNATVGNRLAESRAKKRAYNFCRTLCSLISEEYAKIAGEYASASMAFSTYSSKEEVHQKEILCSK